MPVLDTNVVESVDPLLIPGNRVNIRWSSDSIVPLHLQGAFAVTNNYNVDISLYLLNFVSRNYMVISKLASDISNTGAYEITVPSNNLLNNYAIGVIGISLSENYISTSPDYENATHLLKRATKFGLVYFGNAPNSRYICSSWVKSKSEHTVEALFNLSLCPPEHTGEALLNRLPPCPPTRERAVNDLGFREDKFLLSFFHPDASTCFQQARFTRYVATYMYLRN